NLTNPQTLNLYAMVADNPETFADLDGHGPGSMFNFTWANAGGEPELCGRAGPVCKGGGNEVAKQNAAAQTAAQQSGQCSNATCGDYAPQDQNQDKSKPNVPKDIQAAIDRGDPPNGEYNFFLGRRCPDCKYYPKPVQEVMDTHEDQHRQDEHTV